MKKTFTSLLPFVLALALVSTLFLFFASGCQDASSDVSGDAPTIVKGPTESTEPVPGDVPVVQNPTENTEPAPEEQTLTYDLDRRREIMEALELTLPQRVTPGGFDVFLGHGEFGAIPLLDADGGTCGMVEMIGYDGYTGLFDQNGALTGVYWQSNHFWLECDEILSDGAVPYAVGRLVSEVYDETRNEPGGGPVYLGTREDRCAVWALEGQRPLYALIMDAERFTEEEFLAAAASMELFPEMFEPAAKD